MLGDYHCPGSFQGVEEVNFTNSLGAVRVNVPAPDNEMVGVILGVIVDGEDRQRLGHVRGGLEVRGVGHGFGWLRNAFTAWILASDMMAMRILLTLS